MKMAIYHHQFFFFLLVLTLSFLSASSQVFVSIDCGSSASSYQDENLITWSGDDGYIKTGESHVVQSKYSKDHVMDTMRVFKNGRRKNCYTMDTINQGTRVLLRATFYYGNYDGKSSPPSFDLHYDGNLWDTITAPSDDFEYYEVIYVTKSDSISVCLAQTIQDEYPLISAIEVRGLETFMYGDVGSEYPLYLLRMVAYGYNNSAMIRYADDPYDRKWKAARTRNGSGLIEVASTTKYTEVIIAPDCPPPAALEHAVTATTPNRTIALTSDFPDFQIPIYMNWYFSEVTQLEQNETRSFEIFLGDKLVSDPILPPYKNVTEWTISNYTVSSNTTITLVPTNVSTLAPLVNAMEAYWIGDPTTNGTYTGDVEALRSLRNAFPVLEDWSGDPYLPATFKWEWIHCSDDIRPRVTAVLLGSFGLSGVLPDFSSMDALGSIDLHNNSFSGPIPEFLGTFLVLTVLNLADNQFNGSIPASLSNKNGLLLMLSGNPGLCTASNSSCRVASMNPPGNAAGILHMMFETTICASFVIMWFVMF